MREDAPVGQTAAETRRAREPGAPRPRATRAGRVWVGLAIGALLLILLIVFLAGNTREVTISFLGADTSFPLGLALLLAAVCGALITLLAGGTRIMQLRRQIRRQKHG